VTRWFLNPRGPFHWSVKPCKPTFCQPSPRWSANSDFRRPSARRVNRELRDAILEAVADVPEHGKSNIGGWRSRNDLFGWGVPAVATLVTWIVPSNAADGRCEGGAGPVQRTTIRGRLGDRLLGAATTTPRTATRQRWSGVYYVDPGTADRTGPMGGVLELLDPQTPAGRAVFRPRRSVRHARANSTRRGAAGPVPELALPLTHPYAGAGERIAISFNLAAAAG